MNKKRSIIIFFIASMLLLSCDNTTDTIGLSLTADVDQLDISIAQFEATTRSLVADSVYARNIVGYLGKVRDPETGTYTTSNFMTQFHCLEDYSFPEIDSIASQTDGLAYADSCELRLYYYTFYGDSVAPMKVTAYEMDRPMEESGKYYSNYSPLDNGLVREDGIKISKIYTLTDYNENDSLRNTSTYVDNIRILLNDPYTDRDGVTYSNYGTYIMRKYYSNPEYFKNSYEFTQNIAPGFLFESTGGIGSVASIAIIQLNVYFGYIYNDSVVRGMSTFPGTEEVLMTTNVVNDQESIQRLAEDNSCTYLKSPAGIFTEVTLPVDSIMYGHESDTITTTKIVFQRINSGTGGLYDYDIPETILLLPKDSMYSFFENGDIIDYSTSYLATYSSTDNSYTFSNISGLVKAMYRSQQNGSVSSNWNKAVLIPVSISYNTFQSSYYSSSTELTKVVHNMSETNTKLVGGPDNHNGPITISVVYSRFRAQ